MTDHPVTDHPVLRIPPPDFLAEPALQSVLAALPRARLVGGCVRDAVIGRPVADIDLATPDQPEAVMTALAEAGLRAVPTGIDHGTVTAVSGHRGFEITTLRRDVETDGRHARIAFTDDWRQDAARRDFTMNALSMRPNGAIHDYFGGIADLQAGHVRFVGDPATRIAEDYLRILRFFRFHAYYGVGAPDPAALAAIAEGIHGLARLSVERVWSELKRILAAPDPASCLQLMQELHVLRAVMPEATSPNRLVRLVAAGAPPDALLRLASLLDGDPAALALRLRLSGAERDRLVALTTAPVPPPNADDATLRRLLADVPACILIGRLWLTGGDATLRERVSALPAPVFPLHGRDLSAAGVPAGPAMGALLRDLRNWWLEGGCLADAAACRAELRHRLAARAPT